MNLIADEETKLTLIERAMSAQNFGDAQKYLDDYLSELFIALGVSPKLCGYKFAKAAVISCFFEEIYLHSIKSRLYMRVADELGDSKANVERGIRTIIGCIQRHGSNSTLNLWLEVPAFDEDTIITNAEFISILSDKLRRKLIKIKNEIEP